MKVPQASGLESGDVAPGLNLRVNLLNGTGGRLLKVVVSCPEIGLASTLPAVATMIPREGTLATT